MSEGPFFLDVNVPMYAAARSHPYKESCVVVLTEIAAGRLDAVIDAAIIQEILYRFGAIRQWQVGVQMAENVLDLVPTVLPVTVRDVRAAVTLFARYGPAGIKARDALHAAVMGNHDLARIISTDAHFDQIEGIHRLDPQRVLATNSHE